MPDLIGWTFHSPRRFLLVMIGVLVVVVLLGVALRWNASGQDVAGPAGEGVAAIADAGAAVAAADTFTAAWAQVPKGRTPQEWRTAVSQLATPELAAGLALVDPASLPGGRPTGHTVQFASVSSVQVMQQLSSGRRVIVTMVLVGGHWLAADVQPAVGDVGDVPAAAGPAASAPAAASRSGASSASAR